MIKWKTWNVYISIISHIKKQSHRNFNNVIKHKERRDLPFSQKQFQEVARDVPNYHKFVPYCNFSNVLTPKNKIILYKDTDPTNEKGKFLAELNIGLKFLNFGYSSWVDYEKGIVQISKYTPDPIFSELEAIWRIEEKDDISSILYYQIQFELANSLYQHTVRYLRQFLIYNMNQAFIRRCEVLHGEANRVIRENIGNNNIGNNSVDTLLRINNNEYNGDETHNLFNSKGGYFRRIFSSRNKFVFLNKKIDRETERENYILKDRLCKKDLCVPEDLRVLYKKCLLNKSEYERLIRIYKENSELSQTIDSYYINYSKDQYLMLTYLKLLAKECLYI